MELEFKVGDVIVIDFEIEFMFGEFVVVKNGEYEVIFKKYRFIVFLLGSDFIFELVFFNLDYLIINNIGRDIKIIGIMVEYRIY